MLSILLSLLVLQANPNVSWKSELKQTDGGSQIVLTGDIRQGVDHVFGTVSVSSCQGTNCYSPEDFDFDHTFKSDSGEASAFRGLPLGAADGAGVQAAAETVSAPAATATEAASDLSLIHI